MRKTPLLGIIILMTLILHGCSFDLNKLASCEIDLSLAIIDTEYFDQKNIQHYAYYPYAEDKINPKGNKNIAIMKFKLIDKISDESVIVIDHKYFQQISYVTENKQGLSDYVAVQNRLSSTESRVFSSEKYVFNLKPDALYHYLIIESYINSAVMVKVVAKDDYIAFDRNIVAFFTIIYAVMFTLFLAYLLYFLFIRNSVYLYYSAYILSGLFATYWQEGRVVDVSLFSFPFFGELIKFLAVFFLYFLAYLFVYKFLNLNWKKHWTGKVIAFLIIHISLQIVFVLFSYVFDLDTLVITRNWFNITVQVANVIILICAIFIFKRGNRQAGFLMVAWFCYIVISSSRIYYALHITPNQFWSQHAHELAFIVEALILALGLADQVLGYKKSYLAEKDKHDKANKALLAESLINNFLYELKDEALKESKLDNFIKFIENKLTAMLVKYVAVDNIRRLSVKDGIKYTHVFHQQSENNFFHRFYTGYGPEILSACENKTIFSQLVKIESNTKQVQFIVMPVHLNYYNEKVEHECLLFEIKQCSVLNDEEISNLKNFIDKSLMGLIDRKEINQITKHAQSIISAAAEKDRAMRLKDRFFANVSHEFRTPLTLTIAPLKDLYKQRKFLNTSGKYLVGTALSNALELMSLVDKILDIQKLESDTFPLRVSKVNLNDLIYSVIKKLTNWSLDHNQRLVFNNTLNKDIYLYCDLREVRKVIINLISNAIKYSGKDTIIKVSLDHDPEWIYVYIEDNGIGIKQETQKHIFDRYYQGNSPYHLSEVGTGIGLSYVKDVMELHKGDVKFESEIDLGCKFILRFKQGFGHYDYDELSGSKEKSIIQAKEYKFDLTGNEDIVIDDSNDKTTLLIVEDNKELRKYLVFKFNKYYKVITAENGIKGLNKAAEILPDLIISDVMMPEMDGMEMVRRLRKIKELMTIPIIMLTAKSKNIDTIESLQLGADDYVKKPFDFDELKARVDRLILARKAISDENQRLIELPKESIKSVFQEKLDDVIIANISNKCLNVEKLANIMFLDRSTLYRRIKSELDVTPIAYIRKIKMESAMNLLKHKKLTVSETAYACGFDSLSYFSKQFKKTYGSSPSDII